MKICRIAAIPASLNILLKGQLAFLNKYYEVIAVSSSGIEQVELANREGVQVKSINIERKISIFKDLHSLWMLYIFFKKEKPEIVHSITPKAGLLSMIAAKIAGVPVRIHTFTGLIFPSKTGIMKKILIQMDKLLCYCATNVYPEGKGVKADLINFKITSKPLKVIANGNVNGIDLEFFNTTQISEEIKNRLRSDLKLCKEDFVFIFVGRLVKDKGINEMISAFTCQKEKNIKLLLVGSFETDLDPLLPETINEISNNPNIISVGFQNDVRPYFAISNALLFPSYREGFPNVVLQAGAMGLPSIVSNINGCNEIIIDGENGIIIPIKNSIAIFDAMKKIFENETFHLKLKYNSRKRIVENYEQSVVWNAILKEYKSLEKNV